MVTTIFIYLHSHDIDSCSQGLRPLSRTIGLLLIDLYAYPKYISTGLLSSGSSTRPSATKLATSPRTRYLWYTLGPFRYTDGIPLSTVSGYDLEDTTAEHEALKPPTENKAVKAIDALKRTKADSIKEHKKIKAVHQEIYKALNSPKKGEAVKAINDLIEMKVEHTHIYGELGTTAQSKSAVYDVHQNGCYQILPFEFRYRVRGY
jgi:hypothetical protein